MWRTTVRFHNPKSIQSKQVQTDFPRQVLFLDSKTEWLAFLRIGDSFGSGFVELI